MSLLIMAAAAGAAAYGVLMGWMCRGAFCSQYDELGVFDRVFSWAWGLFDRPARLTAPPVIVPEAERDPVTSASNAALAAATLYTLVSQPSASDVLDREAKRLRNLLAAVRAAA